jgi:hypothetical protein
MHDERNQKGSEDGCDMHPAFFLQEFLETIHHWSSEENSPLQANAWRAQEELPIRRLDPLCWRKNNLIIILFFCY